jgi:hypothetical protein
MSNVSADKLVLGTVQFGSDYGITNATGKPSSPLTHNILSTAWEYGIRRFDTAPDYNSESILGEFIISNGVETEIKITTKIPPIKNKIRWREEINRGFESSLNCLNVKSIENLIFHSPADSYLLSTEFEYFDDIRRNWPIEQLGVSVYEPKEVAYLESVSDHLNLIFQFPYNILDRRFENVNIPTQRRYARSIFLQGLLISPGGLRPGAPKELVDLAAEFKSRVKQCQISPVQACISFAHCSSYVDYFLIGVQSKLQLDDIFSIELYDGDLLHAKLAFRNDFDPNIYSTLDPRHWNSIKY